MVLLSFLLALPANELVLPVLLMQLGGHGVLASVGETAALGDILLANGWDWRIGLCTLLFFIFHFPCSTTLLTIQRETGKLRCTIAAILLPTLTGMLLCALTAGIIYT